ncbi:MAG TPA: pyridoxal phosphate-dependent aminotransferase [Gammaproteobacteria bacterium]|nr:pyridoxal phosphate-dependent aminotransferase [Gammaproteobacteria bacterium]
MNDAARLQASRRLHAVQAPIVAVVGEMVRRTADTISLAQGVVYYDPPDEALRAVQTFMEAGGRHQYGPVQGEEQLLNAISEKLRRENGIQITPDSRRCVVVTAGANMGFLNALFAVTDPGDEIILPSPYYFNHEMAVRMLNCVPVSVATDENYQPRLDALRAAIGSRTRAIVTISPNNPTGAVYSQATLEAVNRLCAEHALYHISDEAYEHFTYDGVRHISAGAIPDSTSHTISLYSLSKSYGFAGWRIGYMVIPEHLFDAVLKTQDTNLICATRIAQHAAVAALETSPAYRERHLATLSSVRKAVRQELQTLSPGCRISDSPGAFYLFLRLETEMPPMTMVEKLIHEHKVAVLPGHAFGFSTGCYLRVSYGALRPEAAVAGIRRLAQGIRALI